MSETKIKVPEGMLQAALDSVKDGDLLGYALEGALRWLAENPIVPTSKQVQDMIDSDHLSTIASRCAEWQRRMFLVSEPEVPEAIKDLMEPLANGPSDPSRPERERDRLFAIRHNEQVAEAFRRGQKTDAKPQRNSPDQPVHKFLFSVRVARVRIGIGKGLA